MERLWQTSSSSSPAQPGEAGLGYQHCRFRPRAHIWGSWGQRNANGGDAARSPQVLLLDGREEASLCLFRAHSDGTFPTAALSHWQEAELLHVDSAVPPASTVPREVKGGREPWKSRAARAPRAARPKHISPVWLLKEQTMAGLISPPNVASAPCCTHMCSLTRAQSMAPGRQR